MESSAYFLGKAEQCRRLAKEILAKNDPAIETLLAMAAEFEGKAIGAATHESNAFPHNGRSPDFLAASDIGKDEGVPE
jgi:hypothetical protein